MAWADAVSRHLILLAFLSSATLIACSHVRPYYRQGEPRYVPVVADHEIDHRLLLVGDAGEPRPNGEPTLELLRQHVSLLPERTTVVFLGDNVYERGMPDPIASTEPNDTEEPVASKVAAEIPAAAVEAVDATADALDAVLPDVFLSRREAERYIDAQVDVVRGTPARAIFIPGNHDWDQFELGGWDRVINQEMYLHDVAGAGEADVTMLPAGGCPGPVGVPLGENGQLIILDTQWWLETRVDGKPTARNNPTECPYTKERSVRAAFLREMRSAALAGRRVVVAGHHPLVTEGPHGGFADVRTHLFPLRVISSWVPFYLEWLPLPVIGSTVVWLRDCCSPSEQDTAHARNRHMRRSILGPMIKAESSGARPLVYAAGHEHSLQVHEADEGPELLVVSGLGTSSKASDVRHNRDTLFAHSNVRQPGFMQIDFLDDGTVRFAVVEHRVGKPYGLEIYSRFLG